MRAFIAALLAVLWFATAPASTAAERITDFSAEIKVEANGDLIITENITVVAEGDVIQRGIYRDFPTVRGRTWWGKFRTSFDVMGVTRDGVTEPWFTNPIPDGVRLYTGSADVLLDEGTYEYAITYKTDRQIGFFEDRDELYWNVTGNFWSFRIDRASAAVMLPSGASILNTDVFTGDVGATAKNATLTVQGTTATARTTQRLDPGEGLTIGIAFTPGVIARPTLDQQVTYLLRDNIGSVVGAGGLLVLLIYYLSVWSRYGRDPEPGPIVPEYNPPKGLSPAGCRYVLEMGWHPKAFTAAIIDLGVKGYVTMGEVKNKHFFVTRTDVSEKDAGLSAGETQMAQALFKSWKSLPFTDEHRTTIISAQEKLQKSLSKEFDSVYFVLNRGTIILGVLISGLTALGMAFTSDDPAAAGVGLLVMAALAGLLVAFIFRTVHAFHMATSIIKRIALAAPGAVFALVIGLFQPWLIFDQLVQSFDVIEYVMIGAMAAINVIFFNLMEAPTRMGRTVMSHIEGFRHYLSVAEKDRMNFHNPPDLTPTVFEKMLPYAIALDVEHEWGEQFDNAMERATAEGHASAYTKPRWYDSPSYSHRRMTDFASGLQKSVAASVATATAPPSSGGSGGGGFSGGGGSSGGGGGGGGGGGW